MLAVLRAEDLPVVCVRGAAHVKQLLHGVGCRSLGTAIDLHNGSPWLRRKAVVDYHCLAAAFGAHHEEGLPALDPRRNDVDVLLHLWGEHQLRVPGLAGRRLRRRCPAGLLDVDGLPSPPRDMREELPLDLPLHQGSKAHREAPGIRGAAVRTLEVREGVVEDAGLRSVHDDRAAQGPLQGLVEVLPGPGLEIALDCAGLALDPRLQDAVRVHVILRHVDHSAPAYGGGRREAQVLTLEDKIDVGGELDALPAGHGEQAVVVQDRVQRFDPLGVDVSIAHNP